MSTERRLEGRIAVVTGSNSGIGLATARRFLAEGATVVTADRDPSRNPLVAEGDERVVPAAVDVTAPEQIEAVGRLASERFGRVDILVNNAGITGGIGRVHEYDPAEYERVMNTNVRGPFLMMREIIPLMLEHGGSIVNVASIGAVTFAPGSSAYPPSKAAVLMLSKQAAIEYARDGIRVNAVAPGLVETPILGGASDVGESLASKVPIGRLGRPEEIAALIAFLASDEASFTTGAAYFADGGHTAV